MTFILAYNVILILRYDGNFVIIAPFKIPLISAYRRRNAATPYLNLTISPLFLSGTHTQS